jgi:SAM-dependent methyltransferase
MDEANRESYWGRFARDYDQLAEFVVTRDLREQVLRRLLEEKNLGKVLECGCGTGFYTEAIAQRARHVTASDVAEEMLAAAGRRLGRHPHVLMRLADCRQVPFPAAHFHTVFMANVLHAVEEAPTVLRESHRVLKTGGTLIIVCYTDDGLNWMEKMELAGRFMQAFRFPPPHGLKNYSPVELRGLVEGAGFRVEALEVLGRIPKAIFLKGKKVSQGKKQRAGQSKLKEDIPCGI